MSTATYSSAGRRQSKAPEDWTRWSAHLAAREQPLEPWRCLSGGKTWPLNWACRSIPGSDRAVQLGLDLQQWIDRPSRTRTGQVVGQLEQWLASGPSRCGEPAFGLECLSWAYVLSRLATVLPAAAWWETLEFLVEAAGGLPDLNLQQAPLAHQWLAGELPLTLAYQVPELKSCSRLARPAAAALRSGVRALLDGNGLPAAEHLDRTRPLLACWTRAVILAEAAGSPCLDKKARMQFDWFVRRALQLTRETGSPVFSTAPYTAGDQALFAAALGLAGDEEDGAIADQVLPDRAARTKHRKQVLYPEAAENSEWGRVAILRPDWLRGGQQLVIAHHDGRMRSELNCGQDTVWSGEWTVEISIDGRPLAAPAGWDETCWYSDDDVDYLEYEAQLGNRWVLQRQILLAREDRFVLLADAVLGPAEADIGYRTTLPLGERVRLELAAESWEGRLLGSRLSGLVLPLALPEWRTAPRQGELESAEGKLQLSHRVRARRLYAPLFVDVDIRRRKRQFTWRQLTVAEQLQILQPDQAVAYRVQVDDDQWLFYRSLAEAGNRTVLGQNLCNEFLAARFDRDGDADELIRIDPA